MPPGARFDPITPLSPGMHGHQQIPSGEPDPNAEPMVGPQIDPVHPGWRPPRGPPPGAGPFGFGPSGGGAPPFFR